MLDVALSVEPKEPDFLLKGALLTVRNGCTVMVATDGQRLVRVESTDAISGILRDHRAVIS